MTSLQLIVITSPTTWQKIDERQALRNLKKRQDIIIKPADKGSGTVVMDKSWYIDECNRQLNYAKFYRQLDGDITDTIQQRVTVYIERLFNDGYVDEQCSNNGVYVRVNCRVSISRRRPWAFVMKWVVFVRLSAVILWSWKYSFKRMCRVKSLISADNSAKLLILFNSVLRSTLNVCLTTVTLTKD